MEASYSSESKEVVSWKVVHLRGFSLVVTAAFCGYFIWAFVESSDQPHNTHLDLLLAFAIFSAISVFYGLLEYVQRAIYLNENPEGGTIYSTDLPFSSIRTIFGVIAFFSALGGTVVSIWVTILVFPLRECGTLTGAGCTALHVIAILFIIGLSISLLACSCLCCILLVAVAGGKSANEVLPESLKGVIPGTSKSPDSDPLLKKEYV